MLLSLAVSFAGLPLVAQSFYGGLRGRVTDAQGSVIVEAKVQIVDDATNVSRATLSNKDGEFVFTSVNPATYTLMCEGTGFKKFDRKVIIGTQQFVTLDVVMEIGAVTETVNVTEEVPLMETSNASLGTLLDRQKLVDLPNIGRNPFIMAWITPNVVPAGDPRFVRFQDQSGSSQVSFGGGPIRGNVYLLDGVPITDGINRAVLIPSIEAVQEMKIQLNTYDAELGRYAGGVYNTFLKSGSNDVHGSLFGNVRTTELFANDFFANRNGLAKADSPYKLFGWSIGGPVYVPKVYNGKNKTFFWLVFEGYRQKTGQFTDLNEPTSAERNGDFSKSFTADKKLKTIFDPLTTRADGKGGYVRDAFPGNVIPAARMNPISRNIAAYFRDPNKNQNGAYGAPNYAASAQLTDRANEATGKVDHVFTNWWRANLAYLHYGSKEPGPDWYGTPAAPGAWLLVRYADVTSMNHVLTPTPTTVVNIRYGYNRFPNDSTMVGRGFDITKLGFPSSFASQIQTQRFPSIGFTDLTGMGTCCVNFAVPNSKSFLASVAKFAGGHSYKAGFQTRTINWDNQGGDGPGSFNFDAGFTRRDPINADGTGTDLASFLLGYPAGGSTTLAGSFKGTFKYYAGYFHDDYRVRHNLTLNLGLRYEYEQGYRDRNNRLVVGFDRRVTNPIAADLKPGSGILPLGGLLYAGVDGNKTQYGDPSSTRFAPRIGVAWQVNGKTVIRGGYGMFWAPPIYGSQGAPGYAQETPYIASIDGGITPSGNLGNPYPNGLIPAVGNSRGLRTGLGTSIGFWNENMHHGGLVHQYSFDIQRTLPSNINASIGFVGSLSRHLAQNAGSLNINQLNPSYFSQGNSLLDLVDNPFFGLQRGAGFFSSAKINRAQLLKPFPEFSRVTMSGNDLARARYESLVFRVEKRFSGGLSLLSHFTLSKNRDTAFAGTFFSSSSGFVVQNAYDYDAEYSLAANHTPRRFVTTVTYELPFGKGKKFLTGGGPVNYILGGWQFNAIATYQSGFPLSVGQANNLNDFAGANQRPNATGISPHIDGSPQSKLNGYINPAAFSQAPRFTFGNVSRTISELAPGQKNWDVSLFKSVKLRERVDFQFRAEALNFTNTARFYAPSNTCVGCGSFGYITQQANFPRFIQLGGRIAW